MMRRVFSWLIVALNLGGGAYAQTSQAVPEYTMKAAYLYNFALLTTWPSASTAGPFNLCLYGQDTLGPALEALNGKEVNGQKIQVRHIERIESALQCRLIFINETNEGRVARLVNMVGRAPILTVVDDGLARPAGAMISLAPENRRLTFEVNATAVKQANLQVSSRLLQYATKVVSP
jgi:hypothetical protein